MTQVTSIIEIFAYDLGDIANKLGVGNNSILVDNNLAAKTKAAELLTMETFNLSKGGKEMTVYVLLHNGNPLAAKSQQNPNIKNMEPVQVYELCKANS